MELNTIKNSGSWRDVAASINENNAKIDLAIMRLENSSSKNAGIFNDATDLENVTPGEYNVVAWIGLSPPYRIWKYTESGWIDTAQSYSPVVDNSNRNLAISIEDGEIIATTSHDSTIDASMDGDGNIVIIETF